VASSAYKIVMRMRMATSPKARARLRMIHVP
jgi:hypothetical protein